MDDYCRDMNIAQIYAQLNRRMIIAALQPFFDDFAERHQLARLEDQQLPEVIESVHNYIDFSDNIVRKGSIAAYEGKPVIIPLNMRDGVVIGFGKSNPEWNYSALTVLEESIAEPKLFNYLMLRNTKRTWKESSAPVLDKERWMRLLVHTRTVSMC